MYMIREGIIQDGSVAVGGTECMRGQNRCEAVAPRITAIIQGEPARQRGDDGKRN